MAADDTAGSFVTSNVTATNDGWTDATPVLITSHKLNDHNAVTAMDLASGKMIGNVKEYNGLYILGSTHIPTFNKIVLSANCPSNILLWHYRFGLRTRNAVGFLQSFG
ncbi:Retrovirus-related Pol polyprotein from transposon TNT 1-94 [Senna tora]|uniref:Retrovirus-related Pol polyprotein from transposon TNT 1-94 n=1 Tax=Senna tora TaxID=362788 RepID=A0A834SYY9_9FABA|nr:Retrovirus-related Pol polyprotein from transposon TNT 1-94 [Senna tora]